MAHDYIPQADGKFAEFAKIVVRYVTDHIDLFRINPEILANVQTLLATFEEYYSISLNPNRGKVDVLNKTIARKALEKALRVFIKGYITYNPEISDSVRESMGLPVHASRSSSAPPVLTYPECEIGISTIRRLIVHFRDSGSVGKAKPKGVHGVEIRMEILAEPPVSVENISQSRFATRSPYTVEFDESQRGRSVYICLRWESNKGEKGPWGEIVKAIIP
jgi:hypothetical protein